MLALARRNPVLIIPTVRRPSLMSPENSLFTASSTVFLEILAYSSNTARRWAKLRWHRIWLNLQHTKHTHSKCINFSHVIINITAKSQMLCINLMQKYPKLVYTYVRSYKCCQIVLRSGLEQTNILILSRGMQPQQHCPNSLV